VGRSNKKKCGPEEWKKGRCQHRYGHKELGRYADTSSLGGEKPSVDALGVNTKGFKDTERRAQRKSCGRFSRAEREKFRRQNARKAEACWMKQGVDGARKTSPVESKRKQKGIVRVSRKKSPAPDGGLREGIQERNRGNVSAGGDRRRGRALIERNLQGDAIEKGKKTAGKESRELSK